MKALLHHKTLKMSTKPGDFLRFCYKSKTDIFARNLQFQVYKSFIQVHGNLSVFFMLLPYLNGNAGDNPKIGTKINVLLQTGSISRVWCKTIVTPSHS